MEELFIKNNTLIEEKEWVNLFKDTDFDSLETNKERVKRKLKQYLIEAVKKRTENIDNFGILFSGGIDSTIIALICKQLGKNFTCYTVGLENAQDIEAAKKIAEFYNFSFKFKILTLEELDSIIKEVTKILNEPDVMKVSVASVLLSASKLAKEDNVNILFSGLGSEEIFAGYQRHELSNLKDIHKECWSGLKNMWERDLKRDFLVSKSEGITLLTPFLDKELIETAMKIHPMYKIDKDAQKSKIFGTNSIGNKKIILRETAEDIGLNKEFAQRQKKAAQYGSKFIRGIDKLAKKNNFELKKEYLKSILP